MTLVSLPLMAVLDKPKGQNHCDRDHRQNDCILGHCLADLGPEIGEKSGDHVLTIGGTTDDD